MTFCLRTQLECHVAYFDTHSVKSGFQKSSILLNLGQVLADGAEFKTQLEVSSGKTNLKLYYT